MNVYWCNTCNIPIINNDKCSCGNLATYVSTDLRPVFPEEKQLLYNVTGDSKFLTGSVWGRKGNQYIVDGSVIKVPNKTYDEYEGIEMLGHDIIFKQKNNEFNNEYQAFNEMIKRFCMENEQHLNEIEFAAIEYINKTAEDHKNRLSVVSFSGGKDSTVVSNLAMRALGTPSILHLFGNTTLELPMTYEYVDRYRKNNNKTPFLESKSEHNFDNLCESMGPPSRVMSWCCTVFKTGPLNYLINGFATNKQLLTYYGIRGHESASRSDYQDVSYNSFDKTKESPVEISPKIAKQKVTSPIFDWFDIDVWLYLLANDVDFNDAYRLGFTRVGCWCCPNNSNWSMTLSKIYMPEESNKWNDFLIDFAKRIGKEDAEVYVAEGKWKARQGGAGLVNKQINLEAKVCADEEYARTINLTRPISEELYEYFKPFGTVSKELGRKILNEVYIIHPKTKKTIMKMQGRIGSYTLKLIAVNPENYSLISKRVDCQLRKFQSCIGCLGCVSVCPSNAISYKNGNYHIQESKCTNCLKCISPWTGGCLMTKVLAVKKGGN